MRTSNRDRRGGFTLIELMVSLTILAIILGIVYGAYSSVVNSIETARLASERLVARQFIDRSLSQNLSQASEGWSPGAAYRTAGVVTGDAAGAGRGVMRYPFLGSRETTGNGPADQLSFVSSAPMIGGAALPGAVKLCTYEITEREDDDRGGTLQRATQLTITESPWIEPGLGEEQTFTGAKQAADLVRRAGEDLGVKPVSVSLPIYAWELAYFDGNEWLDQWDAQQLGRLPWSVRVRVKIASPEDDAFAKSFKLDPESDPDVFELLFPVPAGMGVLDSPPDYVRPSERGAT